MNANRIKEYVDKARSKISSIRNRRRSLSKRYIKGFGLEIGALHNPLPLPKGAFMTNIDLVSREENIKKYPELNASEVVVSDHIDDGFVLSTISEESQDFLIANHVLEHAPNPIQVLINWVRVVKPNGILFVTVPIGEKCFDKGRALTTLQHLIDDFELYNRHELEQIDERNKSHLIEWITISEPNVFSDQNADYVHVPPSPSELKKRIDETDLKNLDIHFHTFSIDSFKSLIRFFTTEIDKRLRVEAVRINGAEIILVLRKQLESELNTKLL